METAISPRSWQVPSTRATLILRRLLAASSAQREYMWLGIIVAQRKEEKAF